MNIPIYEKYNILNQCIIIEMSKITFSSKKIDLETSLLGDNDKLMATFLFIGSPRYL